MNRPTTNEICQLENGKRFRQPTAALTLACSLLACLCLFLTPYVSAQTQPSDSQPSGVLRIKVKPKVNGKDKELPRKRFYLIKGGLEENKALIEKIDQQSLPTRDCFYKRAKASDELIKWLDDGDCESVYCRSIEEQFLTGAQFVPEFQAAYKRSLEEYKIPELGRLWLTTNLTSEIRDGFYRLKRKALMALISEAESTTGAAVVSVMTDRKGTAYFTDLKPGTYLVSNLVPVELNANAVVWTCEVKVGSVEKRLQIPTLPNSKDKNVKCVVREKPLPACDATKQTASIK